METLNTIQQLAPATTVAALLALPWITALFMHAAGPATDAALDDKWNTRAGAALRWAGTVAGPAVRQAASVTQLTGRRTVRNTRRARFAVEYPHAA